jgi:hypothetical protein
MGVEVLPPMIIITVGVAAMGVLPWGVHKLLRDGKVLSLNLLRLDGFASLFW